MIPTSFQKDVKESICPIHLYQRARNSTKRVLLLDEGDERVMLAAQQLKDERICCPVILQDPLNMGDGLEIFSNNIFRSKWKKKAVEELFWLKIASNNTIADWDSLTPLERGALLLKCGYVDAAVAGAQSATAKVLRAGLRYLGADRSCFISSFFLMVYEGNMLAFADCAVVPEPSSEQLSMIAISTADNFQSITGIKPIIAFLSFSTMGSATHSRVDIVRESVERVRSLRPDLSVDGELQFDAAFEPEVAKLKATGSSVAGNANIYIFPSLEAGNIAYKIAQRMGGAHAIGPVLQGFEKPWMDLSRGCGVRDIVDLVAIATCY